MDGSLSACPTLDSVPEIKSQYTSASGASDDFEYTELKRALREVLHERTHEELTKINQMQVHLLMGVQKVIQILHEQHGAHDSCGTGRRDSPSAGTASSAIDVECGTPPPSPKLKKAVARRRVSGLYGNLAEFVDAFVCESTIGGSSKDVHKRSTSKGRASKLRSRFLHENSGAANPDKDVASMHNVASAQMAPVSSDGTVSYSSDFARAGRSAVPSSAKPYQTAPATVDTPHTVGDDKVENARAKLEHLKNSVFTQMAEKLACGFPARTSSVEKLEKHAGVQGETGRQCQNGDKSPKIAKHDKSATWSDISSVMPPPPSKFDSAPPCDSQVSVTESSGVEVQTKTFAGRMSIRRPSKLDITLIDRACMKQLMQPELVAQCPPAMMLAEVLGTRRESQTSVGSHGQKSDSSLSCRPRGPENMQMPLEAENPHIPQESDSADLKPTEDFGAAMSAGSHYTMESTPTAAQKSLTIHNPFNGNRNTSMEVLRAKTENDILGRESVRRSSLAEEALAPGPQNMLAKALYDIPLIVLRVCGVLPFETQIVSTCYSAFILSLVLAIIVVSGVLAAKDGDDQACMHLVTMCLAIGTFLGICSIRGNCIQDIFGTRQKTLEVYASYFDFLEDWIDVSILRALPIVALWFVGVLARIITMTDCSGDWEKAVSWMPFCQYVVVSGVFAALTYSQVHVASGLQMMVESWCIRFFHDRNVDHGIVEWNTLQAVLRRTASIIETCIFLLQTSVLACLVVVGVETLDKNGLFASSGNCAGLWGLSALLPVIMSLYAVFRAATVTEKCMRVPSLINSIAVDSEGLHTSCFRLVDYITNSAAGFYIKGIRVTAFMVVKFTYFLGAVVLTLVIQMRRKS